MQNKILDLNVGLKQTEQFTSEAGKLSDEAAARVSLLLLGRGEGEGWAREYPAASAAWSINNNKQPFKEETS